MTNTDDTTLDPDSSLDAAGAPYGDGLDTEVVDAGSSQTVTNDAVAGETVLGDEATPAEAAPEEDEAVPANDGYLAPAHQTAEDVDLDDAAPGTDGPSA
jgi:hypothetical protein